MKATAIIKDKGEQFWSGFGSLIIGFDSKTPMEQFLFCAGPDGAAVGITTKIGDGTFRDRMKFHDLTQVPFSVTSEKHPRRGYTLVEFQIHSKS